MLTSNAIKTLVCFQRGETYYPPGNNCTFYECDFIDGQYVLVTTKKTCPTFDPSTCEHVSLPDQLYVCSICFPMKAKFAQDKGENWWLYWDGHNRQWIGSRLSFTKHKFC